MAIRFPKMHIAKSTVNRILNVADEIDRKEILSPDIEIPSMPESDPKGTAIDIATATSSEDVAAPPGIGPTDVLGPNSIL